MTKLVLFIVIAVSLSTSANAQDYPAKPVRVIITSAAGGPPDTATRGLTELLRQELRQPFIVENIPAANGIVAVQTLMRTAPDGYTLLSGGAVTVTLAPALFPKLPYEPLKDLAPVSMIAHFVSVFVAHPSVEATSLRELVALARARPNTINFGTGGRLQISNLYAEWMRNAMSVPIYNVPYKDPPQALAAVASGQIQATYFALGGAMAQAKAGKVRILAVNAERRLPAYPDLPTVKEEGVNLALPNWMGWFATAATPRPIVQRLNAAITKATANRDYVDKVLWGQGLVPEPPSGESPEAVARFIKADLANYDRVIREARIPAE